MYIPCHKLSLCHLHKSQMYSTVQLPPESNAKSNCHTTQTILHKCLNIHFIHFSQHSKSLLLNLHTHHLTVGHVRHVCCLQHLLLCPHSQLTAAVTAKRIGLRGLGQEALFLFAGCALREILCAVETQVCKLEYGGMRVWVNSRMVV